MTKYLLAAIGLALALDTSICPAEGDEPAIDLERAKRYFDQAKALSDADDGRLWGRPLYGPVMFVDRETRMIAANQSDQEGLLSERDGVYLGALPLDRNMANSTIDWAGVEWTMLIWPLPPERYRRGRLLVHEMYHRIQDEIGLPGSQCDNGHLDERDGRIWLRMEWRALSEALIRDGEGRLAAIADALLFRAHRRALYADHAADESAFEMHEGLAEYTGFRAGGLPRNVRLGRAALQLDTYDQKPRFVLTFAYASGPAYGLLLDELADDWRSGLTPESDLGVLLGNAYDIELPSNLAAEASSRAINYDGQDVIAEETKRDQERSIRLAEYQSRFVDGPTLTLPLEGGRYSYNPNNVGSFKDHGNVYHTARITGPWGVIEVSHGGALLTRDEDNAGWFIVSAPESAEGRSLQGDGWSLELEDGWTLEPGTRTGDYVVAGTAAD